MVKTSQKITASFFCLLLAACGGGEGSGGSSNAQVTTPQAATGGNDGNTIGNAGMGAGTSIETTRWTITPILTGGFPGMPSDFNDAGTVVGTYNSSPSPGVPSYAQTYGIFLEDTSGQVKKLAGQWQQTSAYAINNAGQILGYGFNPNPNPETGDSGEEASFLYSNGKFVPLPLGASRLNKVGDVAGTAILDNTDGSGNMRSRAFVYSKGAKTDIDLLPGRLSNTATAINDAGQVVGFNHDGAPARAFLYSNGTVADLGVLPGYTQSRANDINNVGQVVGESYLGDDYRDDQNTVPFLYESGVMKPLPTNDKMGKASSINDHGQVVGYLYTADTPHIPYTGFIYSGGKTVDLSTLPDVVAAGWTVTFASVINNKGQILGYGYRNGEGGYFILTPAMAN